MKIIHVTQFLGIGGLEKIIFHLILEQMAQGHDVALYVYDHDREWLPYFQKMGISIIPTPQKKRGYDFQLIKRMHRDLMDADVIHTHDLNPLMYLFIIFFLRRCFYFKVPRLIHTTHGLGHVERFPKYKIFEKYITPIADKIVAVSEKVGAFYTKELNISSEKIIVIENGISTFSGPITKAMRSEKKTWLCSRHKLDHNRPVIVSLSRILPLKDQLFIIKAFKKRPMYQLLVVGPASDQHYFDECKKWEDQNMIMTGAQELVSEYNLGADLYVSASTHEGIPVAVLEAMAVETPCLVSSIPGHKTLNQYGTAVDFFEPHQEAQFLDLCDKILINKDHQKEKVELARKIVEDHFSVKKMVNEYMREYSR
ncbi:MAG: glycosyltransferase family 4 protein [Bacteriovorax sp.]|jgi:glycosyltransferase involved in cell wall biosynthesis|nr:glycosyltransferase family 4 protein [Bacteriovorax sp.]